MITVQLPPAVAFVLVGLLGAGLMAVITDGIAVLRGLPAAWVVIGVVLGVLGTWAWVTR